MSMFDNGLARSMADFNGSYNERINQFLRCATLVSTDDGNGVALAVRLNGYTKEYLKITMDEYENAIRLPVQCTRQGNNAAQKFFMWHWLEEQNKLDLFFNKLKEMQNA
jgi:hypothetical protein